MFHEITQNAQPSPNAEPVRGFLSQSIGGYMHSGIGMKGRLRPYTTTPL
jgi:hypothetical protein